MKRFPGVFIDEVQTKEKIKVAERANRVGVTKRVFPYDPMTDVSIKGGGEPPLALGYVASPNVTGLTGGVFIVKERTATDKNEGFDDFEMSATHYPDGEIGTVAA
ncbi:MAG: hypothetical protein ABMA13_20600 [Chthoniobacteraceae bacterium]